MERHICNDNKIQIAQTALRTEIVHWYTLEKPHLKAIPSQYTLSKIFCLTITWRNSQWRKKLKRPSTGERTMNKYKSTKPLHKH